MSNSKQPLNFFDLPPELRNRIYEFAFPCRERAAYNPVTHYRRIEPCRCFAQPLMRVSRRMRSESVSLHYSLHEFHFSLFPPTKAILLSWLDTIARDSISHIRRFVVKRYVKGTTHYWGEQIQSVTVDLNDEKGEVQMRVSGKLVETSGEVMGLVGELLFVDGRQELSKEKLLDLFEAIGWH